jgi:hypothetical protein
MSSLPQFPMLCKETNKKKMVGSPKYKKNYNTNHNIKQWTGYRKSRSREHRKSPKPSQNV